MNLFFNHPAKKTASEPGKPTPALFREYEYYTNEGSEFLDDAIRTKEQPLLYAEETIASNSSANFI